MENKIKKLYLQDCIIVLIFMIVLWSILVYVLSKVVLIAPGTTVKMFVIFIGIMAGTFATAAMVAVLVHLKKNQKQLYTEEILASKDCY